MIQYRKYGSAPYSIALIHGGPGAGGEMAPIARELCKHIPAIFEPIQTATTLQGQIDELHQVLCEQCLSPVILIGYSWGAWLSTFVAAQYPDIVGKLILVGCPPFEQQYVSQILPTRMNHLEAAEQEEFQSILAKLSRKDTQINDNELSRLGYLAGKADTYDPLPISDHEEDLVSTNAEIFQNVFSEAATLRHNGELISITKKITCPVIAIHGDYDPHPAEGVEQPLNSILPDFRFILLRKCGHTPWLERHGRDSFYKILLEEI